MKQVYCYNTKKTYSSLVDVALKLGTTRQNVSDILRGYRGLTHYKGNYLCYSDKIDLAFIVPTNINKNGMVLTDRKRVNNGKVRGAFQCFNRNGELVAVYKTTYEAANSLGCSQASISHVLIGRTKTTAGYSFKRI